MAKPIFSLLYYYFVIKFTQTKIKMKKMQNKQKTESCPHTDTIGDNCVTNCRKCGIFIPKVSKLNTLTGNNFCRQVQKPYETRIKALNVASR